MQQNMKILSVEHSYIIQRESENKISINSFKIHEICLLIWFLLSSYLRKTKILELREISLDEMNWLKFLNITPSVSFGSVWLGMEVKKDGKGFVTYQKCH